MKAEQVDDFLQRFTRWASSEAGILAAALVGSYARGQGRPDSDVDLVLICASPQYYLASPRWVLEFGDVAGRRFEDYGKLTSLRVWYGNGLEVEYGIAGKDWAALPLDEGTRQVIADGMVILYERDGLLSRHLPAAQVSRQVGGLP